MDVRASMEELEKGPAVGQSNTAVIDAGPGDASAVNPFVIVRSRRCEPLPEGTEESHVQPWAFPTAADLQSQVAQLGLHDECAVAHASHASTAPIINQGTLDGQSIASTNAHAEPVEQRREQTCTTQPTPADPTFTAAPHQLPHPTLDSAPSTTSTPAPPNSSQTQPAAPNLISRFRQQRSTPSTPSLEDLAASARAALSRLSPGADPAAVADALGPLTKEQVLEFGLADLVLSVLGEGQAQHRDAGPSRPTITATDATPGECNAGGLPSSSHSLPHTASEACTVEEEVLGEESSLSVGQVTGWGRMLAYRARADTCTSTVATSEAGDRQFDEENPFQVLDESLVVLAEVEGLIRESLGLAPGATLALGDLDEEDVARVPQPLLDALEGTISVIMESRSEIEEITSALLSPASTSGYVGLRGREAGRGAAAGRSPGPAGGRLGSPYTSDRGTSRTTPTKQGHRTPSKHIRQLASHPSPHASSPSQPLSAASASPSHGPPRGGGRGSYGSGQGSASGRGGFASGSVRRDSGSGGGGSWDDGLGPSASNVSVGAASSVGGSSRVTIGGRSAAGGSTANGYLYQRVAARQAALEEEERRAALEARRRQLESGPSLPDAQWVAGQEARAVEARRRRIQQVAQDLAYIDGLRARTAAAREQHLKAVADAEASMAGLRVHKAETQATNKWLKYQEHVAARERMRRALT